MQEPQNNYAHMKTDGWVLHKHIEITFCPPLNMNNQEKLIKSYMKYM